MPAFSAPNSTSIPVHYAKPTAFSRGESTGLEPSDQKAYTGEFSSAEAAPSDLSVRCACSLSPLCETYCFASLSIATGDPTLSAE